MTNASSQHESKTRILDAAMHVIRAKGYSATTIDDVCKAADLTKGSFFHHFKSKDELALAAADHYEAMVADFFKTAPYHGLEDPLDRVLGYIDCRAAMLRGKLTDFTCLLGTMVQETYDSHPAIRAACDRHISAHAAEMAKNIAEAKKKYAPRAKWTPESLALYIIAVFQGSFILAKAKHGPEVAVECIVHLRRYVEMLLSKPVRKEN